MKQILFRFANGYDTVFFIMGAIASLLFGLVLPGFCLFFGKMIDDMGESTQGATADFSSLNTSSL
jgi:hypothetical protein